MVKFQEREMSKQKFYVAKRPIKIWDVNVDKLVV